MAMSKNLGMYTGLRATLDKIRADGRECVLQFDTPTKARNWRQRAYYFRKLLHEQQAAMLNASGMAVTTSTPYDDMIFRDAKDEDNKPIPNAIAVCVGDDPIEITFAPDGERVFEPVTETAALEDEQSTYNEVAALVGKLDLKT